MPITEALANRLVTDAARAIATAVFAPAMLMAALANKPAISAAFLRFTIPHPFAGLLVQFGSKRYRSSQQ
jgi:hypothetical protein